MQSDHAGNIVYVASITVFSEINKGMFTEVQEVNSVNKRLFSYYRLCEHP
jgi:hypothetical protein